MMEYILDVGVLSIVISFHVIGCLELSHFCVIVGCFMKYVVVITKLLCNINNQEIDFWKKNLFLTVVVHVPYNLKAKYIKTNAISHSTQK